MLKTMGFCFVVLLLNCGNPLWAQDQGVFSPVGQKLAEELLARNRPNLLYVGLHVAPPGETTQFFIAATGEGSRSKIGKSKSSCTDLWEVANGDGAPALELKGGGGSMVKGVLISMTAIEPLRDQSGATIGLLNLGLKFPLGEESEAVKFATRVGQELAAEIPSKAALFEGAQKVDKASRDGARGRDPFELSEVQTCPMIGTRLSGR